MRVLTKSEKKVYEALMKNIKWKKIKVPVTKNPFGE
tara:strand:+ start:1731 stop:1838 length:108 start_codon:yes stop_codon:yes gene_type:complete